jgi:hypothetical protein
VQASALRLVLLSVQELEQASELATVRLSAMVSVLVKDSR